MSNSDEDKIDIELTEEELAELITGLPQILNHLPQEAARQI